MYQDIKIDIYFVQQKPKKGSENMQNYYFIESCFVYVDEYLKIESVVFDGDGKVAKPMEKGE